MIDFSDLKVYLQVTGTSTDALLASLVTATIATIESEIGATLTSTVYTAERMHYERSSYDAQVNPPIDTSEDYLKLYTKNYPITAITLTYGVDTLTSYTVHSQTGIITMYEWHEDRMEELRATYTAGYTQSTLPKDLQYLIYDAVKEKYEGHSASVMGSGQSQVSSKKVGDFSVSYRASGSSFVNSSNSVISKYRRWGF